jgi:valyl-tRNA synthetase
VSGAEVYVLGVVDPAEEKRKLGKQRDKLTGQIAGKRKKLENQGFVAKAPAEVVERERRSLAELESQLQSIEATLAALE